MKGGGNKRVESVAYWRRELNAAEAAFSATSDGHRYGRPVVDLARARVDSARRKLASVEETLARTTPFGKYDHH